MEATCNQWSGLRIKGQGIRGRRSEVEKKENQKVRRLEGKKKNQPSDPWLPLRKSPESFGPAPLKAVNLLNFLPSC